ncbi:MAG: hypothetical protein ACYS3S_09460, partial [Planctomycetota bacterium]
GAIGAPIVYVSGLFDWRIRFEKRRVRIFTRKCYVGAALVLTSVMLIIFRLSLGDEFTTVGALKYIYAAIIYLMTGMVTYLGYIGGKFIV